MKILNLGLDDSILNKNSASASRIVKLGEIVEKYTVIVPAKKTQEIQLSSKVKAFGVSGSYKFLKLYNIWKAAGRLLSITRYDVITVQDPYFLALIGLLLAQKFRMGLEIQVHGWEKFKGIRKRVARYVLRHADSVRTVSRRLERQLVKDSGVSPAKITVVPIFSEKPKIDPAPKQKTGEFVFLTVGRLVPVKNIKLQIRAMAEITKKYADARLWVVGGGPERDRLEGFVKKLKLEESIKFFGQQDDLKSFYAKASAFLLTSNFEGWGLVVIEAAAAGLPIIMTDVGCAGEVIKNGENGLIISIDKKEELVQAMGELLSSEELRRKLASAAQKSVMSLPDLEKTKELYLASWKKTLDK